MCTISLSVTLVFLHFHVRHNIRKLTARVLHYIVLRLLSLIFFAILRVGFFPGYSVLGFSHLSLGPQAVDF